MIYILFLKLSKVLDQTAMRKKAKVPGRGMLNTMFTRKMTKDLHERNGILSLSQSSQHNNRSIIRVRFKHRGSA